MVVKKLSDTMSPLCFLPNGTLICYQQGYLFLIQNGDILKRFFIFKDIKETIISRNNLLNRLLRLGIRTAIALNNEIVILSIGKIIYEYNFKTETLSKGFDLKERIRPLIFTEVKNVKGFENMIIFGGYLSNKEKKPVHIYKRIGKDTWDIVYTFPEGTINHVHNIIPDLYRNCLWFFTGDFESSAAIWKATDNFKNIECILSNSQQYRACVAFTLPEGLLYATDTPFTQNYIYFMKEDKITPLSKIDGSCIYGCKWKNEFVFSSTVEGDGYNQTIMSLLFGRKRGQGIKDKYIHLYSGNIEKGFRELYKLKKDILPFIFQFGVFKFPVGENTTNELYFQPIASTKYNLDLLIYKKNNNGYQ